MDRCNDLAACTEDPTQLTRRFCSPAMVAAHQKLRHWMTATGMPTRLDPLANLIGRFDRSTSDRPTGQVLLVGSHLDTVVNAGRYDGPLGVLIGLGLAELLRAESARMPFAIDVIGFCEEEGIRYRTPFIGSRAVAGNFDSALLDRVDECGVSMRSAVESFRKTASDCVDTVGYDREKVVGYIEPHIEQGPVLEQESLPVGIVTAIAGQTRAAVRFIGRAGHAGTVPMSLRHDALAGAAEWIMQVESIGRRTPGAVATVAQMDVIPNVSNVLPGEVRLRIDARHSDNSTRHNLVSEVLRAGKSISEKRGLKFVVDWQEHYPAVQMDAALSTRLAAAVAESGVQPLSLVSGAGHDAAVMAGRFPAAMLFLRCRGGLSHHPDESVRADDVALALEVLVLLVYKLAAEFAPS